MKNTIALILAGNTATATAHYNQNNWSNCTYFSPYYYGVNMGEGIIGTGYYSGQSFVKFVKNYVLFSENVVVTNIDKSKREVSIKTPKGDKLFIYKFDVDLTKSTQLRGKLFSLRDNELSLIANTICTGPLK